MNANTPHQTIMKITEDVLIRVAQDLEAKRLDKKHIKSYQEEISRISLFKAIFREELDRYFGPNSD